MGERDVCFNKRYGALDLWPPHLAQEGPGAFGRDLSVASFRLLRSVLKFALGMLSFNRRFRCFTRSQNRVDCN